jgi:diguanylate cyclase (GGDEF)-like protein
MVEEGVVREDRRTRRRTPHLRTVLQWLMPGAPILLVAWVLLVLGSDELILDITGRYRWVVYGLGFAFAAGFHRSRIFVVVLGLGALDLVTSSVSETDILSALGTVLLVLIGALSLMRDRGVASRTGMSQIAASMVLAGVPWLIFYDSVNVEAFLSMELVWGWMTRWTGLPQAVAFFALVSIAATAYGVYRWRGAVERTLFWSQLTVLVAIHPGTYWVADSLLLMAAGLILAITVLQTTYAMAYRDDLTGLPARRALMRDLDALGTTYTVAMVDVDHFKRFNDKYGHDVGDQVLKLVAGELAEVLGGGRAYRYGGEEFTLLFPGRVRDETIVHLNAMRVAVEGASFSLRKWHRPKQKPTVTKEAPPMPTSRQLSITVSIGVSDSSDPELSPEEILKNADAALYRAKDEGRNRVST